MLGRRRSIPEKRVFGMKTDRTNKGNSEANVESGEWIQEQSWSTLGSRIYEMIRWLHPRRLVMLLASAIGLIKRIALVIVHGRRGRRARLIAWFSDQLRRGGGCAAAQWAASDPCDLRAVWREGALLCALVNALVPGACPDHPDNDLALAQEVVARQWALPPAFTDDELLQVTFSSHFERRLLRYLSAIQQASERLPETQGGPTPDSARSVGGIRALDGHTNPACVARGMGLFTATQYRRASFFVYLLDADPSDVFVVIQTQRDFGFARVGVQGCVLPSRYSNIPITISQDTGNGTRVTFTPQSYGQHELVILRKGVHIPGSPFCIPVEKTNDSEKVDNESVQSPVRRKKLRVLLRTVDFVTEKMVLTDDGKLKKISQSFLDEHLKTIREGKGRSKPEIYIYVSEEGSTMHQVWGSSPACSDVDSDQEGGSKITGYSSTRPSESGSSHVKSRHDLNRAKCLHRQNNLDSTVKRGKQFHGISTSLVKGTEFQSRCKKIITMCKFVLEKSRKRHGLRLLSAVRKIIDGRPIRMSDEIELMLKNLTESIQPITLEPVVDCKPDTESVTAESEEVPESSTDQGISPSPLGDVAGTSEVAVHTQIKCFEDKLAYCNEYIESVLQQNTVTPENPDEMKIPSRGIDVREVFGNALDVSITHEPIETELSQPISTDLVELGSTSSRCQSENDAPTNSLKVEPYLTPDHLEPGELSPRSELNLTGFWPASSSSPSSMSEASNEAAAAKFPDLDAFLSGQFTKYMESEAQFHLWPSDIAFGDVQDTICAMEDDEMVDFDSVISAPNLEEALVKLEQGLRMKSSAKRDSIVNLQDDAVAGFSGDYREEGSTTGCVDDKISLYQNEGVKIYQDKEHIEQNCMQNKSPDNIEFVVNPPDQGQVPDEDLNNDYLDEVDSNPSPQAGDRSVEGWDSAYLSIDDLKGSPENHLTNNSTTSSNSIGSLSREKVRAFRSDNGNTAITGFMGPAEKEIWGFEDDQDDDNEFSNETSFYPRVLTPLTNMMSLIVEEDEEKIISHAAGDGKDLVNKCLSEVNRNDLNLVEARSLDLPNRLETEMRYSTNETETFPVSSSDLDQDFNGNETLDILTDHNFDDASNRNVTSNFESNFEGLLSDNLDSELDGVLDDTLDEDVSVAFDALIAEQLDLFEQGSDFDSALAEALQVSALQQNNTFPIKKSGELYIQETNELSEHQVPRLHVETKVTQLSVQQEGEGLHLEIIEKPVHQESTEIPVHQESTEMPVHQESTEKPVQQESTEIPVHQEITEIPILAEQESAEMPVHQESTEEPVHQESTEQPVQQESTEIPEQQESTEQPVQQESTEIPVQQESTEMPVDQESTEKPEQQENAEKSEQQESTEMPVHQDSTEELVQQESTEEPVQQESTEMPVHQESTEELVQQESTEEPVQQESTEQPVQQESTEMPVHQESTEMPVHHEITDMPVQQELTEMPVQQESTGVPVQKEISDLQVQGAGLSIEQKQIVFPIPQATFPVKLSQGQMARVTEVVDAGMPKPHTDVELAVQAIDFPDLTSTICTQNAGEKHKNKESSGPDSLKKYTGEKVDEEPIGRNLKIGTYNTCFKAAKLTVHVEADCNDQTTTTHEAISNVNIPTEKCASEFSCKTDENTSETNKTNTLEKVEEKSASLTIDVEEIIDVPEEENRQDIIDIHSNKTANNDLVKNNNVNMTAINQPLEANLRKQFTTKEYVSFKKEYWDRKVQMLDLVSKHSQPRSTETTNESSKKPTHTAHNHSKCFNLPLSTAEITQTFATGQPATSITSEISSEKLELPRSPSLYRARRVLVCEDSDDGCILTHKTDKNSRHPQDEYVHKDCDSAKESTKVKESYDVKTEYLPRDAKQCKEADIDTQIDYSRRKSRPNSNEDIQTENLARMSQLRKVAGDTEIGKDPRGNFPRRDLKVHKDRPEEMKARFQTAKEFFQSLEKSNSRMRRGTSSESDVNSVWETASTRWREPLGGSERVRAPRRCHIKDLF